VAATQTTSVSTSANIGSPSQVDTNVTGNPDLGQILDEGQGPVSHARAGVTQALPRSGEDLVTDLLENLEEYLSQPTTPARPRAVPLSRQAAPQRQTDNLVEPDDAVQPDLNLLSIEPAGQSRDEAAGSMHSKILAAARDILRAVEQGKEPPPTSGDATGQPQPAPAATPAAEADASKPDIDINQAIDDRLADLKIDELRESVVSFQDRFGARLTAVEDRLSSLESDPPLRNAPAPRAANEPNVVTVD